MRTQSAGGNRPAPMTDGQYRTLAQFRHALRVFVRFSELSARQVGLTPAQHQLLLAVRGWPEPTAPAIGDLADMLQSQPHSTLELARRVEDAGLIRLEVAPTDRRRQLVSLTSKGDQKLAALSVLHREELRRFRHEMNLILDELN
jgi:DNA-binding MarR family transcriptional regulator